LILQILRALDLTITIGPSSKRTTKGRQQERDAEDIDLDAIADTGLKR
jgi:hypothetical protein